MRRLGIDVGSLYLTVVLVQDGAVGSSVYREHGGRIEPSLREILSDPGFASPDTVGITGSLADPGVPVFSDSMLATVEGARHLLPGCRNVIFIGGQSFALVLLDEDGAYREHTANPPCAAGTGSFLEQQAERLGLEVHELSRRAAAFTGRVPRIATRCAVFAKTDIIHAMQEGHTLEAICAGLCEGISRNVLDTLLKGRTLTPPVGLVGGVSLNARIAAALEAQLGMTVSVPRGSPLVGAVGAALLGRPSSLAPGELFPRKASVRPARAALSPTLSDYPSFDAFTIAEENGVEVFLPRGADLAAAAGGVYLGIDIGSTSTKAVMVTPDQRILGGFYTRTAGDPLGAVQKLLARISAATGGQAPPLCGVSTTGSGRRMVREVFAADAEVNEITAHARAAVFLHPEVDTIIEIGGQDSKFTRVRDGQVYFSTMNYVCAAGTGSFIEEQAKRLEVSLEEFAAMALRAPAPFTSDRCTVYMERDLSAMLGEGWSREALAAAVLHSVRDNYLSKVVSRSPLGATVVFQGATARNRALVAAFEQHLGVPIHVSPWCHLTGALGAALLCREARPVAPSAAAPGGTSCFLWETGPLAVEIEECRLCANRCHLTVVQRGATRTGWGMKCGREYAERAPAGPAGTAELSSVERRFHERMAPLYAPPSLAEKARRRAGVTFGIPGALTNVPYGPLWHAFLSRLGVTVRQAAGGRRAMDEGSAVVNSDFCAPMIVAHGYVKQLLDSDVDYVFHPAVTNERDGESPVVETFRRKGVDTAFCYYSQYFPTIVDKLTAFSMGERLITPMVAFREKSDEQVAAALHEALLPALPDLEPGETRAAFDEASRLFRVARARQSADFPRGPSSPDAPLRVLLMGRPYVAFDPSLNLSLPRAFERLGAEVYWQDELDLSGHQPGYAGQYLERMHWHFGRQVVKAAETAALTENLYPVFLTCFRCSPDSFLLTYVKDILSYYGTPFLVLQLDAHASDVGYATRIEAALQSFRNDRAKRAASTAAGAPAAPPAATRPRDDRLREGDTVLVAALDDLISRFWADSFTRAGHPAVLMETTAESLNTGYRYASGGECMPIVSIVGSAIETIKARELDPARTFFFMPTIPLSCNMPQFPVLADMAFRSAGLDGVRIGRINFMALADTLPPALAAKLLETYIVAGVLYKLRSRIRPYAVHAADADAAFEAARGMVSTGIGEGADLRVTLSRAVELFRAVERDESGGRKPRVALLGDLYVKYNEVLNERIQATVEALGGELLTTSMSEYALHFLHIGATRYGEDERSYRILRTIEGRFESTAKDLVGDQGEPDFAECARLMEKYGLRHYLPGETAITLGRALALVESGGVEAIIHANPLFCCPGVVSASLFRKLQEDFGIPIIDIFYDGTGSPNRVLIPHLHYLGRSAVPETAGGQPSAST
jgi:predicted CoA-substrate-specific enzyme activase